MNADDRDESDSSNRADDNEVTRGDAPSPGKDRATETAPAVPARERVPDEDPARPPGVSLRTSGQRLGVIAAVLALLIGLGAWLVPHPRSSLCHLTGRRGFGCNDVPGKYLGTWKGRVDMDPSAGSGIPSGIDSLSIHRAEKEQDAAEQRAVDWHDANGQQAGCSHVWKLARVLDDMIELTTDDANPAGSRTFNGANGCLDKLTLYVQRVGTDAVEIRAVGPLLGPGTYPKFKGTLYRVTG